MWSPAKQDALRLARRLVAQVPASPGRRAFVDITPIRDERDHLAEREGWVRRDVQRSFRLAHWDYDERRIDGWDYDVDARQVRLDTVVGESKRRPQGLTAKYPTGRWSCHCRVAAANWVRAQSAGIIVPPSTRVIVM
jgi:hypothetical protein